MMSNTRENRPSPNLVGSPNTRFHSSEGRKTQELERRHKQHCKVQHCLHEAEWMSPTAGDFNIFHYVIILASTTSVNELLEKKESVQITKKKNSPKKTKRNGSQTQLCIITVPPTGGRSNTVKSQSEYLHVSTSFQLWYMYFSKLSQCKLTSVCNQQ